MRGERRVVLLAVFAVDEERADLARGEHVDDGARVHPRERLAMGSRGPSAHGCHETSHVEPTTEGRRVPREDVLSPDWEALTSLRQLMPLHPEVDAVAAGSFRQHEPPRIHGGTYVVHSLEAALWAFAGAGDFRTAVLRGVNLGDDADTTGAVTGQLAGACWGESSIPREWLAGLARRDLIEEILGRLAG